MVARAHIVDSGTVGNIAALEVNVPLTVSYLTNQATVWGKLTAIFTYSTAWTY